MFKYIKLNNILNFNQLFDKGIYFHKQGFKYYYNLFIVLIYIDHFMYLNK